MTFPENLRPSLSVDYTEFYAVSRPEIASLRLEEGHWEGDTVVGKRTGKESVVFSLLEKKTGTYLAFRIPGKTSEAVMNLMNTHASISVSNSSP